MINQDSFYRAGFVATALSGTTPVVGTAINRGASPNNVQTESLEVICKVDGTTGTPSSFTVNFEVQHCDDNSTWVDVDPTQIICYAYLTGGGPPVTNPATQQLSSGGVTKVAFATSTLAALVLSAANTMGVIAVDGRGLKQYVRAQATPAFVGGSAPTATADCVLHFSRLGEAPCT